jgi:hypothetical protein
MLIFRHGMADGQLHIPISWGGRLAARWIPVSEHPCGKGVPSPETESKTAFSDLAPRADEYREVAS